MWTLPGRPTPDGRPGCRVMIFAVSTDELQKQLQNRVGQCVLTSSRQRLLCRASRRATQLKLGAALRYFGDGWQIAKRLGGRRFWRIPVMDGEFLCEATTGLIKEAVGGGNLLLLVGHAAPTALAAAEAAVAAIDESPARSCLFRAASSAPARRSARKYKGMIASTNDAFAPTLRGVVKSELGPDINAVLEIVIDGETSDAVAAAMRAGIEAVVGSGRQRALRASAPAITAASSASSTII